MKNLLNVFICLSFCLFLISCSSGDGGTQADGDSDSADNAGESDAVPDGDDLPDGDNTPDGDDDKLPDGDDNSDGDDIPDGDNDIDSDESGDMDSEPEPDEPLACTEARGCPQNTACHDGFCGDCADASECRKLEACLPDGSCGVCTDVSQCRDAKACLHGFCMPDAIIEADIAMSEADFTEMHEYAYEDKWYDCSMTVDGTAYGVGEKLRVLGSYSLSFPKRSFRITFPEDVDNPGYSRKMNYKAEWGDFTFMRSFISYHLFRTLTTIPTPRTRYVKLDINDVYYGLMLEVERIGESFLEENGRDRDRSMYEAAAPYDYGALVKMLGDELYSDYYEKPAGADESDFSDLADFLENTLWPDYLDSGTGRPTLTTRTRQTVDLDSYIDYLAIIALIENPDVVTNNFYFSSQNNTGSERWEFYPWDMDLTWGCRWTENLDELCVEPEADHWWLNGIAGNGFEIGSGECWCNLLTHLVLNDEELLERYKARICQYLDSDIWRRLPDLAAALQEYLTEAVAADQRDRNPDISAWEPKVAELVTVMAGREEYLREEVGCE